MTVCCKLEYSGLKFIVLSQNSVTAERHRGSTIYMGCIRAVEIIPAAQKSQTEMHSAGRNNPCGAKESDRDASDRGKVIPVEQKSDRDASDRGKVIPVEQKSPIEMHPAGRNNPCGTKEPDRDASGRAK